MQRKYTRGCRPQRAREPDDFVLARDNLCLADIRDAVEEERGGGRARARVGPPRPGLCLHLSKQGNHSQKGGETTRTHSAAETIIEDVRAQRRMERAGCGPVQAQRHIRC